MPLIPKKLRNHHHLVARSTLVAPSSIDVDHDEDEEEIASSITASPSKVSIVSLGCSGFSTFFWTENELQQQQQQQQVLFRTTSVNDTITIPRDHPKVREWIDTILYAVRECGINLLDTAPWYGHGTSEIVVGYALEEILWFSNSNNNKINRNSLIIQTKVGRYDADPKKQFDFSYDATISSTQRSLQRLFPSLSLSLCSNDDKYKYIDVLQLHDPEFAPNLEIIMNETIPAMVQCKTKYGYCKSLGLTGYPLEVQYQIYQRTLELYGERNDIWDQALTYGHFNLHDSSLVHRRIQNSSPPSFNNNNNSVDYTSYIDFCHQHNIKVLAAAPLSMGLLTNNSIPLPGWHPANNTELSRACQRAGEICQQHDVDIATLAILFSLSHPAIPTTILGMHNIEQVKTAATIAKRFANVDWTNTSKQLETHKDILCKVLTEQERNVYKILNDKKIGPFATIWNNNEGKGNDDSNEQYNTPKYQWDGIREAHIFWTNLEGTYKNWQMQCME